MPFAKRNEEQRRHLRKKISSDILARGSNTESCRSRAVILSDQLIFYEQNAMSTLLFVERLAKWAIRSQQKERSELLILLSTNQCRGILLSQLEKSNTSIQLNFPIFRYSYR